MRGVKVELLARRSGRQRAVGAGRAKSGEGAGGGDRGACGRCCCCGRCCSVSEGVERGAQRWRAEEGERWRARQAVAAARRASLAHGRHAAVALWRWSGRGARERLGAARRQAVRARWAGPDERRARWQVEPASVVGREARRRPVKG